MTPDEALAALRSRYARAQHRLHMAEARQALGGQNDAECNDLAHVAEQRGNALIELAKAQGAIEQHRQHSHDCDQCRRHIVAALAHLDALIAAAGATDA